MSLRILHVLDHSVPLQSGYAFRTLALLREQRALGWETFQLTTPKHYAPGEDEEDVAGLHFYRTRIKPPQLERIPLVDQVMVVNATAKRLEQILPVIRPEEPLHQAPGYVVVFRHILALPGRLLQSLVAGLTSSSGAPPELQARAEDMLLFPAGLIGNLKSPHVEHLLQRFSHVFSRVGVDDCSFDYKSKVVDKCVREFPP